MEILKDSDLLNKIDKAGFTNKQRKGKLIKQSDNSNKASKLQSS